MASAQILQLYETKIIKKTQLSKYNHQKSCIPHETFYTENFQISTEKNILKKNSFQSTTKTKCLKNSHRIKYSKKNCIAFDNNSTYNRKVTKKWKNFAKISEKRKSKFTLCSSDDRIIFVLARNENFKDKKMPRTAIETNSLPVNKIPNNNNNDTNTKSNQNKNINKFSSVLSNHNAFMPSGNVTKTGNQFTGSFKQCSSYKINSNENEKENQNENENEHENEIENENNNDNQKKQSEKQTQTNQEAERNDKENCEKFSSTIVSRQMQLQTKRNLCCQNIFIDFNNKTIVNKNEKNLLQNRIDKTSNNHNLCYIPAKDSNENLFQPITCQNSKNLCSNRMPPLLSSYEKSTNNQKSSNTAINWTTKLQQQQSSVLLSSNLYQLPLQFQKSSKTSNSIPITTTNETTKQLSSSSLSNKNNQCTKATIQSSKNDQPSNCPSERNSFKSKFQFYSSNDCILYYSSIAKNFQHFPNHSNAEHNNNERQYSKCYENLSKEKHQHPHQEQQNSNSIPSKSKAKSKSKLSIFTFSTTTSTTTTTTATIQNNRYYRRIQTFLKYNDLPKIFGAIFQLIILFNMLPLLYAVASDFDASELRSGPNPDPRPWIPVVAYLEPLPRPTKSPKCDQTFVSRVGGPQNGTFTAPMLINPTNHSRQCLYIFLAGPKQRVEVIFTSFNLRGNPPDGSAVGELPSCGHEYMDIYTEVQSSDPADLINSPFGGRYCGPIAPRRRISMFRSIALSFFTNKNASTADLFEGRYTFINASEYEIGIPIAGSPCSYTITPSMSINKTGSLISPTYPGAYPKDMSCTYQFLGESNQRVRLEFRDFDLFFGGPHCPFDYVKVYDGPDNSSALIGTYCGQQRNLVLYSSESSLFVHFYTLPRTANSQNRGFKGIYEFSESFVKLDFIRQNDGIHMRGSECDQKILSRKESTGYVLSPNYPFPYIQKTVCRYFIYGMQDAQHLERVRLEFFKFEIPKVVNNKTETNCSDGYLKVYLKGQETADAYDKFDYELCGNETNAVVSDGPRLAMVFSSGELQGRGFKAKYTFETEYKIPGTAAPDGSCSFTYRSTSKKKGELNSPRYPSNYPSDTNCSYFFLTNRSLEQVTIVFDHFKVKADSANETGGNYGTSGCFEDWLEIYVVYNYGNDRFLGRYCSLTAPGPVESPRGSDGLRIVLHTDHENVASGFKARYMFEAAKSEVGDCGGNYSQEESGIIVSPNYPQNYKGPAKGLASMACNWFITAKNGYKISINFESFSIEGDPALRGCPAAVLRLWTNVESDYPPIELCGEKPVTEHWHYISQGQSARISFITSDKTIGSQGFRIVWTEIQDSGPGPPSSLALLCESTYHFQCSIGGYCIADRLRCDGIKNCGPGDDSDEMHCTVEAPKEDHGVLMICSMAAGSFLICLLCTLCHRKRKRRHHRQLVLHRNAAHYDSTTSATGLSSSRRHLQSGGSLAGSLHGINSGTLTIPPAPLPPTSVPPPPHICIAGSGGSGMLVGGGLDDDDDDDDEEDNRNIFINDIRFDDDDDDDDINNIENV